MRKMNTTLFAAVVLLLGLNGAEANGINFQVIRMVHTRVTASVQASVVISSSSCKGCVSPGGVQQCCPSNATYCSASGQCMVPAPPINAKTLLECTGTSYAEPPNYLSTGVIDKSHPTGSYEKHVLLDPAFNSANGYSTNFQNTDTIEWTGNDDSLGLLEACAVSRLSLNFACGQDDQIVDRLHGHSDFAEGTCQAMPLVSP